MEAESATNIARNVWALLNAGSASNITGNTWSYFDPKTQATIPSIDVGRLVTELGLPVETYTPW